MNLFVYENHDLITPKVAAWSDTECLASPMWILCSPIGILLIPDLSTTLKYLQTWILILTRCCDPAATRTFWKAASCLCGAQWPFSVGGVENTSRVWDPSLDPTFLTSTWSPSESLLHLVWVTRIALFEMVDVFWALRWPSMGTENTVGASAMECTNLE